MDDLNTLEKIAQIFDTKSSIDEFVKAFGVVVDSLSTLKADSEEERAQLKAEFLAAVARLDTRTGQLKDGVDGKRGKDGKNGKDGHDGVDGKDGLSGKDGKNGKDGSTDTAEEVRAKLSSLEGDARLDVSAIKGIEKIEKRLGSVEKRPVGGWSAASGGKIVKVHDLSGSLDGITKTFSLPAFWRVISINLSSFPSVLRPTVDYTSDAAAMQITFTSQIDAPTSLAAGQTCIIIYAES